MGEQHPRIKAGISEGDRPWGKANVSPTAPLGSQPFHQLSLVYIGGDYHLTLNAFGPEKPDKGLPDFCGIANYRFRCPINGGGSLQHGHPAVGWLLRGLTAAADADVSQTWLPLVVPNLPWASFKVDQGSGWLGLSTGPDGAWWLACLPFAGDGNTVVIDAGRLLMDHADDASLLLRVPPDLPLPVYEGLKRFYYGLKRDAESPRYGGNFA